MIPGASCFEGKNLRSEVGLIIPIVFRIVDFENLIHFRTITGRIFSYGNDSILELPILKKFCSELKSRMRLRKILLQNSMIY